jgi:cob(I)alamin adenosyltransferase
LGHRLSKIYTKTGDNGTTGLGIKDRIAKDSLRIHVIGEIDELNSFVGHLVEVVPNETAYFKDLRQIQHDLFDLGGELAMPGYSLLDEAIIDELEARIDRDNAELEPLKNFILPGGNEMASRAHLCRSICRRAERMCVTFNQQEETPHLLAQKYLNRLSDYLFVLSRALVQLTGDAEILWQTRHKES